MQKTMKELKEHSAAWAFLVPVNGEEVVDYYDFIKEPMGASILHSLSLKAIFIVI
jgi:histone acetyltransferase